ncbi:spore coat protein [Cytobacillus sp. Hz8]|uniref:spore coat protein n=1 Tax=Cytobacillus sp. Hz8 TaxID=3347168 RepID=UPI0035D9A38A
MQQQINNNQSMANMTSENISPNLNHGAHEILDIHEVLGGTIIALDSYLMFDQHAKDPVLKDMIQRQRQFITNQYNTLVESFKTGKDPSQPTTSYKMAQSNDVIYGLTPSQPKHPATSVSEISDECISSHMLTSMKTIAGDMAKVAGEVNNPVARRVLQDSIPNYLEMAYEIFLYQNKNRYYQVPQFDQQDAVAMVNTYAQATMGIQQQNQTAMQHTNILQ